MSRICSDFERARRDDADQQQGRAGDREQQESGRRPTATLRVVRVAPPGDDEPHRDERELEEHEEQQQVERAEHAERRGADDQHEPDQRGRGVLGDEPHAAEQTEQRRHQQERPGDVRDAEVQACAERLDPRGVDLAGDLSYAPPRPARRAPATRPSRQLPSRAATRPDTALRRRSRSTPTPNGDGQSGNDHVQITAAATSSDDAERS